MLNGLTFSGFNVGKGFGVKNQKLSFSKIVVAGYKPTFLKIPSWVPFHEKNEIITMHCAVDIANSASNDFISNRRQISVAFVRHVMAFENPLLEAHNSAFN